MPMTKDLVIGWPETFVLRDAPDESFLATRFYVNAPAAGFCVIDKFEYHRTIEFCHEDWPMIALASLPGPAVDPFAWMGRGSQRAKITPLKIESIARLSMRYTGLVPKGMNAGESYRLCVMLIGQEEEDNG